MQPLLAHRRPHVKINVPCPLCAPWQGVAPAGSNRSGSGGNDTAEAFDGKGRLGRLREQAGRNVSERRAGLETGNVGADPAKGWGRPPSRVFARGATSPLPWSHRGNGDAMFAQGDR